MTSENDNGHLLYAIGDFSFIDSLPECKEISEEMITMFEGAYSLYKQHNMKKFFTKYNAPSDHKYMWWLPQQEGFQEWDNMRVILNEKLFNDSEQSLSISADFDLVTRALDLLSNKGWQILIKEFPIILNYIIKNYYDYERYFI